MRAMIFSDVARTNKKSVCVCVGQPDSWALERAQQQQQHQQQQLSQLLLLLSLSILGLALPDESLFKLMSRLVIAA